MFTFNTDSECLTLSGLHSSLQIVQQEKFAITESYSASKGTLIMPSITASSMQGFTDPETFDPDRFSPERQENVTFSRYFLTFGIGPHACVGREYAINHLVSFPTSPSFLKRDPTKLEDGLMVAGIGWGRGGKQFMEFHLHGRNIAVYNHILVCDRILTLC